jgi:hypothetical protein
MNAKQNSSGFVLSNAVRALEQLTIITNTTTNTGGKM